MEAAERRLGPAHSQGGQAHAGQRRQRTELPTADNILDAIDLLKQAKETDTVMLFIAGHGYNDGPSYRFLATDAERVGDGFRGATVVPWQIIQEAVEIGQGPAHAVHRHLPLGQRLQPAARQRRLPRQHHRLHGGPLRPGGDGGPHARATASSPTRWWRAWSGKGSGAKRELSTKELADYVVKRVEELAKSLQRRAGAAVLQGPRRRGLRAGEVVRRFTPVDHSGSSGIRLAASHDNRLS